MYVKQGLAHFGVSSGHPRLCPAKVPPAEPAHKRFSQLGLLTAVVSSLKKREGGCGTLTGALSYASQTVICNFVLTARGLGARWGAGWLEYIDGEGVRRGPHSPCWVDFPAWLLCGHPHSTRNLLLVAL